MPVDPVICANLELIAIGHSRRFSGDEEIGLGVDIVELRRIGELQHAIACIASTMLNGLMDKLRFAAALMTASAFKILVSAGPRIDQDQLKIWADVKLRS